MLPMAGSILIRSIAIQIVILGFCLVPAPAEAQAEEWPVGVEPLSHSIGDVYFADVVVRGRPVLQVGSLPQISATDRANIEMPTDIYTLIFRNSPFLQEHPSRQRE